MRTWCMRFVAVSVWVWVPAASADYREVPVADGGTIAGTVSIVGDVPVLPAQPVYKEHKVCGQAVPDERLATGKGGALKNAVVSLIDVPAGKPAPRDQPVLLDNVKCTFVPHVRAATIGQTLEIHNSDPFLHDAHAWLGTQTLFNVGILPGHTAHQPLNDAGLVHINCNVRHTWMHAYVFVAADPYHAVTDGDGKFVIEQVPPGTYTLRVWHELLGSSERAVTVEAGKTATLTVALPIEAPVPPAHAP